MGVFDGLFRKPPLSELSAQAEALFAAAKFGDAKLAFDRLEMRAAKEDAELARWASTRSAECCDQIADRRCTAARKLAESGQFALAHDELNHALETARSEAARARVREMRADLARHEARQEVSAPPAPLSDEERLTLICGAWEELQAEELARYGEPLELALLLLEDERAADALALLEGLAERTPDASYLHLEIARAQLALSRLPESERALRTFLSRIGPDEGGSARLLAHRELARIGHERGEHEAAIAELEASCAALEGDPRPLLDLGNYLRVIGRPREAVEILEMCTECFDESPVEWPVTMELGLACAEAGDSARAIRALEDVLQGLLARGHDNVPPQAAIPLAALHENAGNLARAADLYRALARGEDQANHAHYHREASRLLEALGLADEAAHMRARAEALEA